MRRGALGTVATIALGFALPAPALAATTWTVDPSHAAACDSSTHVCGSISNANASAAKGDTIVILPKAGGWSESPSFTKDNLSVVGGGSSMPTIHGTVTFDPGINGSGPLVLRRLAVAPTTDNTDALHISTASTPNPITVRLQSAILSGTGTAKGISRTGLTPGTITVDARHVTVVGASTAADESNMTVTFHDSIVQGTGGDATDNNRTSSDSSIFVETFDRDSGAYLHLRADATSAIDQGRSLAKVETESPPEGASLDVDGQGRPAPGGAVDLGADEFYDSAPSLQSATADPNFVLIGQGVAFSASASDPDPGDSVSYSWDFGDGAGAAGASAGHSYATPGGYTATVTATDGHGQSATASVAVAVFAPPAAGGSGSQLPQLGSGSGGGEADAPRVSILTPRPGQRLRMGRTVPPFRGRVADDTGVRSVELALSRKRGSLCQWFDGRRSFRSGSCARPRWFRARINDFAWRYSFLPGFRPRAGAYKLAVRATDVLGNRSAAASVASRTAASFRFVG